MPSFAFNFPRVSVYLSLDADLGLSDGCKIPASPDLRLPRNLGLPHTHVDHHCGNSVHAPLWWPLLDSIWVHVHFY